MALNVYICLPRRHRALAGAHVRRLAPCRGRPRPAAATSAFCRKERNGVAGSRRTTRATAPDIYGYWSEYALRRTCSRLPPWMGVSRSLRPRRELRSGPAHRPPAISGSSEVSPMVVKFLSSPGAVAHPPRGGRLSRRIAYRVRRVARSRPVDRLRDLGNLPDLRRWRPLARFAFLGPGLIAANAGNDSGGIATYSTVGAH